MSWYRIDLASGGSRFIEVDLDLTTFKNNVSDGACVQVLRQVIGVPIPDKAQGNMSMTFATLDQVSPLVASCKSDSEYFNLGQIIGFGVVDTESDVWKAVRGIALKEPVIATPKKGLIIP